jgi:glyoxylase-like metal-dependent hydrolase (beta-lactamase superfamily II)
MQDNGRRFHGVARSLVALCSLAALPAGAQVSHMRQPILEEHASRVSDHVWEITGFPNVAIVVGGRATLVVDTGLGARNGATVSRVAARLAPGNSKLFLTSTHFHPEHAMGEPGFPSGTILIRDAVQQQEMEQHGQEMIELFRGMSDQNKELLAGVVLRTPDVIFEREATVDLGGVEARLLWLGGAHTRGDELVLVEPDHTLISGDVVQNETMPFIYGDGGTPTSWLAVLDKVALLNVAHVVPDHSAPGDGSLIAAEHDLIATIRREALALKQRGLAVDEAGKQVSTDLRKRHPDWPDTDASGFVKSVYADPDDPR